MENETSRDTPPPAPQPAPRPRRRPRFVLRALRAVLVGYVGACALLFVFQRSFQYPGDGRPVPLPAAAAARGVREVEVRTEDGLRLHAWYLPGRDLAGTIVVFHGNGGHRGYRLEWLELLAAQGAGAFLLDYRGYGGSEGSPSEEGLYRDAEAAIAWVRENAPGPLVFLGESLGSGVAVEMARRHDPAGLVIHAGFSSAVDVARGHMPILPVGWLMRDRFDSIEKIDEIDAPKLFIHGREDGVVPYRFGQKLFAAAPEPKEWVAIDAAGHDDLHIVDVPRYYGALRTFLADALPPAR